MAQTKVQLLQPDLGDVIDFDASTLFVDGADNRIGIRNTNPQYELDVTGTINATNFRGNISVGTIDDWITHTGDTNTKFGFSAADTFQVHTSGTPYLQVDSTGRVLIGNAGTYSASGDLHIVGDTNSNGPELYLQVGNNNTTDNIGALWYGNNVDKSLVKLAGHTHTANNTADFTLSTSAAGTLGERLRITSTGVVSINDSTPETWATLQVNNHSTHNAAQVLIRGADQAQIILRDDTGGSNAKCTTIRNDQGALIFGQHNDAFSAFTGRLNINSSGQIITGGGTAISFNNQGNNSFGSWFEINGSHTVDHCGVLGITGNTATHNTKVGRIQFLNIDNTHNSSAGQNTSRSLASIDVYADVANNNSADDSGGRLVISTKAKAGTNNELLFLTAEKTVGINVIPSAGDLATGTTIGTPTFMVDCDHQGNGAYHVARFRAGGDNDNNAAVVTINHSNDRGIAIYGGRSAGNRSWGAIKSIDNIGRVSNAIEIIGDEGQGVQDIKFYTGDATTTTERVHIHPNGAVSVGGAIARNYYGALNVEKTATSSTAIDLKAAGTNAQAIAFGDHNTISGELRVTNNSVLTLGTSSNHPFAFYTNGTSNERLRIKSDGDIEVGGSLKTNNLSGRNVIINGDMRVAQRGTSASMSGAGNDIPACDRWQYNRNGPSSTVAQVAEAPAGRGFEYSLKWTNTSPVGSIAAGNVVKFSYAIERQDIERLGYGSSNAKKATVSFWAKGSIAGSIGVVGIRNSRITSHRVVMTANTWEYHEIVIPADTSTALSGNATDNGFSLSIVWGAGSNSTSGATNGWIGFHNAYSAGFTSGQQGAYLTTNGSTFQITGVQLEVGSVATPFEHKNYAEQLAACQRYYWTPDTTQNRLELTMWSHGIADTSGIRIQAYPWPVTMRTTPTMTYYDASSGGNLNRVFIEHPDKTDHTNINVTFEPNQEGTDGGFKYPYGVSGFNTGQTGLLVAYRVTVSAEF